ncbi:MAG TPA: type II toxin-antitoxin system VapC family toxin [Thermoanaerobaculia bacterium]|nr:type II toxin-antitoxin system VapC family toxin [Thermoanaerobaculia bacterium]
MADWFLDTSYAIALSSETDRHHDLARDLAFRIGSEAVRLVTTRAVLLEIGNGLAKQRFRRAAVELLAVLESDSMVEVVPLSEGLYARAEELFRRHSDKEWGLTDCVSFVVMRERGISEALSTDRHFEQAGFHPLLSSRPH